MTGPIVLVVEDNPTNADVIRENLVEAGYVYAIARNGASGVAIANEVFPDLVLMDIHLPILDGLSATRLLKANTPTAAIPVIALTARAGQGDREMCLAAGCDDYVAKPIEMEVLFAKMSHHLARRPASFVEMLKRQREIALGQRDATQDGLAEKPGMAPRDYEDELASLNALVEKLEGELAESRSRQRVLAQALADREQRLAQLTGAGASPTGARELQEQLAGAPDELRALQAQNEALRRAFLQLHRTVTKAAEEGLRNVAFGRKAP